ncbi:MAG: Na+/H+ antiporter NhaC family protein [Bdellovibrionota bacterium]
MNISIKRLVPVVVVFTAICLVAAFSAGSVPAAEGLKWYSIVPPLLAVCLAWVTNRVMLSLASAVIAGGLLTALPSAPLSPLAWWQGASSSAGFVYSAAFDQTNFQVLGFIILVICMIAVTITSGGVQAIIDWLTRYAKSWRSTQFVTFLMGIAVFFDDYANTMIVGNALRPLTDKQKISREKLAFLVDATSAPVAGIAIVSTWIGYEIGLFSEVSKSLGLGMDGYSMFFDALSFRFYCFFMIAFVFLNSVSGEDFGPMEAAQIRSLSGGEVYAKDAQPLSSHMDSAKPFEGGTPRAASAIIPLLGLFAVLLGGIWVDGGGLGVVSAGIWKLFSLSAWREVISAGENTTTILAVSAATGLLLAVVCGAFLSGAPANILSGALWRGVKSSLLPMGVLILAWSLKGSCDALHTGKFLASTISSVVSPTWFPLILFIVAGMTAFATGTSWGTMAILIPTAVPIAYHLDGGTYGLATMISLGAVLDGAICGDHCSPISDTTIMSSAASGCDHVHHVRTQLPYSLLVAALAIVLGYLPAAKGIPAWACLGAGIVVLCGLFWSLTLRKSRAANILKVAAAEA